MRILFLVLLQVIVFSACHYKTSNHELVRHSAPDIQVLDRIGREIETGYQVTYERANLVCSYKQVVYCYEFSMPNEISLKQGKAIALSIVDGIVERLAADPGIQERVTDPSRRDESIRSRIEISFVFSSKEGVLNAAEPTKVIYTFSKNNFYAMCPESTGWNGAFVTIESYADCKKA